MLPANGISGSIIGDDEETSLGMKIFMRKKKEFDSVGNIDVAEDEGILHILWRIRIEFGTGSYDNQECGKTTSVDGNRQLIPHSPIHPLNLKARDLYA
ncbi:hypothetical protein VNO77_01652 [Canavalia gladiata]|uniref:Uncharacterized protein n=1 Tax=Canavalia gladiata TaxID=3824 RepID=A0AAN9R6H7_CANGL